MIPPRFWWIPVLLAQFACATEPEGLAPTPTGLGPKVVWDLTARPLPEIPFPNDAATRPDSSSPTGRRLNLSIVAPTEMEAEVRSKADGLDGFGTFAPITVKLDGLVDLAAIRDRHADLDFGNDAVWVVDVTPGSPMYGKPVMLDLGQGFFPATLLNPAAYFADDARSEGTNLLFETADESRGARDDFDGVVDRPNVLPPDGDPWRDLLTWYERETNTLILRPVVPLRERTQYAVILTDRVLGDTGTGPACAKDSDCARTGRCDMASGRCREPIRSPFPWVNPADQTPSLRALQEILARDPYRTTLEHIAFAWTFTTQTITAPMKAIREGLHGRGPLARLATEFPAEYRLTPVKTKEKAAETGSAFVVTRQEALDVAGPLLPMLGGVIPSLKESVDVLIQSYDSVDFLVGGTFRSPAFLTDRDGLAAPGHPADDDESFEVDPETGRAVYGSEDVSFVCIVPRERPDFVDPVPPGFAIRRPFPVALFVHGTAASKLQVMGYAGHLARLGIASCAIDAFGHGMPFPAIPAEGSLMSEEIVLSLIESFAPGYDPIYGLLKGTRVRDLNMDGNLDPAGDFWTMDAFHTRDTIRQTVVDLVQFLRVLRSFDGTAKADVDGDGRPDVLGDFDSDGKVDLGGPDAAYHCWGISLGGIVTAVFAGVEPDLDSAVVLSGGGGLTNVAVRSDQPGVPQMAVLPVLGPLYLFEPVKDGVGREVFFVLPNMAETLKLDLGTLKTAGPGDQIRLVNVDSGESRTATVPAFGGFRLQVQADALRATEIRAYLGFDPLKRLGGEPCKVASDCAPGLSCPGGLCKCLADADCGPTLRCTDAGRCVFRPMPVDSTLATDRHPGLGDRMRIEVLSADGRVKEVLDTFGKDVTVNGIVYPAGQPLVALYRGFGYERQTPGFRRFIGVAQTILDPGDPINWAPHYTAEPVDYPVAAAGANPGANVMVIASVGDTHVPLATAFDLARAAGILGYQEPDPRFGKTQMQVLIDKGVHEGLANQCNYRIVAKNAAGKDVEKCVAYDPDDLDGSRAFPTCADCSLEYSSDKPGVVTGWICKDPAGQVCGDGFGIPFDLPEPLRVTVTRTGKPATCAERHADSTCRVFRDAGGLGALRIPLTKPEGFHGMYLMSPQKPFDIETYQLDLIGRFFRTGGTEVWDDPCLEDASCAWIPGM